VGGEIRAKEWHGVKPCRAWQNLDSSGRLVGAVLALRHDRGAETGPEVIRKFVEFGVAINFNGPLGGVANDVAVMAPLKMIFKLGLCPGVHCLVEVVGKLF
jgi:hypothetical protein